MWSSPSGLFPSWGLCRGGSSDPLAGVRSALPHMLIALAPAKVIDAATVATHPVVVLVVALPKSEQEIHLAHVVRLLVYLLSRHHRWLLSAVSLNTLRLSMIEFGGMFGFMAIRAYLSNIHP